MSDVSYVGQATAAANSASLPSFQAGDVAIVFAWNGSSATIPSLPAGWTTTDTSSVGSVGARTGYRVLQGGDTTTGTWTNATAVLVLVYRGVVNVYSGSGNNGTAVSLINWATYAGFHAGSLSWYVGVGGHSAATNVPGVAPAGMTNRTSGGAAGIVGCDTNATVTSWSSTSATVNASGSYISAAVELQGASDVADPFGINGFFGV